MIYLQGSALRSFHLGKTKKCKSGHVNLYYIISYRQNLKTCLYIKNPQRTCIPCCSMEVTVKCVCVCVCVCVHACENLTSSSWEGCTMSTSLWITFSSFSHWKRTENRQKQQQKISYERSSIIFNSECQVSYYRFTHTKKFTCCCNKLNSMVLRNFQYSQVMANPS